VVSPSDQVTARLQEEIIIWLTTVDPKGQPQTSPVWYWWDGEEFWVYSLESARVRNIELSPLVSLNLDGDGEGGTILSIEGTGLIDRGAPAAKDRPEYRSRYQRKVDEYGWSWDDFSHEYSVPIRIKPTRIRSW
jgi:PPOX class probable F420-dependent enzyme